MSYATNYDGTLTCSLSTKPDDASGSMVRLLQEHLVVILRPINEHISDLYRKHGDLVKAISTTDKAVEKNSGRLDLHDRDLEGLHTKHSHMESYMKELAKEVKDADVLKKLAVLEAEFKTYKKARTSLEDRAERTATAMEELRVVVDDSNAGVHKVELKMWQTKNQEERFERIFEELRQEDNKLSDRIFAVSRGVETVNAANEHYRQAIKKVSGESEHGLKTVERACEALSGRVTSVEKVCASNTVRLDADDATMGDMNQQLAKVFGDIKHIGEELHHLEEDNDKQDEAASRAEMARAEAMKKQLNVLTRVTDLEDELAKTNITVNRELEREIPRQLHELTFVVERHGGIIGETTSSVKHLELIQNNHEDRVLKLETQNRSSEVVEADLVQRTGVSENLISELRTWSQVLERRVDNHHVELEKSEVYSAATRESLGHTNAQVVHLHGGLEATKGGLANTAVKLDLAHEYIHGVSKGFQETHKLSLAGQDGFLPSKAGLNRTRPLPMIGSPARPASAGQRGKAGPQASPRSAETHASAQAMPF